MANRFVAWGPAATWAAVLFLLSSIPDLNVSGGLPMADKLAHAVLYAVLGGALAWGNERSGGGGGHLAAISVGVVFGLTDEWHQMYVPGRSPDAADLVADLIGVVVGYGTTRVALGRMNRR